MPERIALMDVNTLKDQRLAYISSLFREGCLDEQFKQVLMLQDADSPSFVTDLITLYCQDTSHILRELTGALAEESPDFLKINASIHKLKGSSASMGANQVKLACINFRTFCEQANKDGCVEALNIVTQKFYFLRDRLQALIQLERKIQALEDARV